MENNQESNINEKEEAHENGANEPNELEKQIAELKDQLLRAYAENENTRKRLQKEKEEALKFGASNLAKDIINIVDNLKRVLENKSENVSLEVIIEGVNLILKDVENTFLRHGIEAIDSYEKPFDPHLHQAVFEVESEHTPGTVVQIIQDGYKIYDRLLRPAMVGVAKAKAS